ncbi:TetR/AcrR family transcriptional regulator [Brachybacterium sp. AOP43-C2-M15]|uniref:TetR/AcrR family transcriptional regulator n=1 Tax=Brachybacterium sp. AOP43-C2-M15 TaxID=3457661 RepID=UPI004034A197
MSTGRRAGRPAGAPQPRREQLIALAVELVGEHGYGSATLGRVAERADLSKASVLHHVGSVADLLRAAYEQVLDAMVEEVGAVVEEAGPSQRPRAYITALVGHFREHPHHTRVLSEAIVHFGAVGESRDRWGPLAELLAAARGAREPMPEGDLRTAALGIGGAIDAIVAERQRDPGYDSARAAEQLADVVESTLLSPAGR